MSYILKNNNIDSVELVDGKLEVIYRIPSNMIPGRDTLEKHIYNSYQHGSGIYLEKVIKGVVIPATLIPEVFEFDE